MPNYYYFNASGQKYGLVSDQQLQALAAQGVITPSTPLETEGGHKGLAGQIPGLKFNTAPPPSFVQQEHTTPYSQGASSYSQTNESESVVGSIFSWLFDFAFRDLRLPIINLWACRIVYVICFIAAIITGLILTLQCLLIGLNESIELIFIGIPFTLLGTVLSILTARLLCEWYIIVFDWIVETTKAARIYRENNEED